VLCRQQPAEQPPEKKAPAKVATVQPVPFVAPEDSAITEKQMVAWQTCNPLLDSLTFRYTDSFKTEDPAALFRYQEDFITAQDKICVRAGLPGGYEEYTWVLQNMGIEKNRKILEAANAQSF
jgi:hypothetical protein